jgi:hypothetical protein
MKYALAVVLLLSACATSAPQSPMGPSAEPAKEPKEKKSWMCHAISAQNEARAHGEGHSATCEGATEACAREKALEACSRYHKDCEVAFCSD